jgi:hypothetical protein
MTGYLCSHIIRQGVTALRFLVPSPESKAIYLIYLYSEFYVDLGMLLYGSTSNISFLL